MTTIPKRFIIYFYLTSLLFCLKSLMEIWENKTTLRFIDACLTLKNALSVFFMQILMLSKWFVVLLPVLIWSFSWK